MRMARLADAADRRAAADERRLVDAVRSGAVDVVEHTPSLRSQQFTMRREQQRAEAEAARPVTGGEVDKLRREITHLRAQLYAQSQG